ncbi:MAG: dihydroorotase family protein [Crenarchaeota archaeon]|nr:dihydroorotase family protein [Thermoproteota archaeon]
MRVLLEGARALVNNRILRRVDVIVDQDRGIIDRICISPPRSSYDMKIRLDRRMIILPGFVDIHVHCRDWRQSHKETIETCSRAAARGGVVKIFDMPNTDPPLRSLERVYERLKYGKTRSLVEYYVHAGVPENLDEINEYVRIGIKSIKMFPEDIERLSATGEMGKFLSICRRHDILIVVHCEDNEIIRKNLEEIPHNIDNHSIIRCRESEISCIRHMLSLAERHGNRIHFTHVSTGDSVLLVNLAKKNGKNVSLDVTPHHMLLTYELCKSLMERAEICKVNPPLRNDDDRDRILISVITRMIDCVVSDHAPHSLEEKFREYDMCPPGFPGLETTSLILLSMWRSGLIDLVDVVKLYCENPCKIVRINYPIVREGESADLCIVDTCAEHVVDPGSFMSKARYSPFKGFRFNVKIIATLCRGKIVYVDESYLSMFSH